MSKSDIDTRPLPRSRSAAIRDSAVGQKQARAFDETIASDPGRIAVDDTLASISSAGVDDTLVMTPSLVAVAAFDDTVTSVRGRSANSHRKLKSSREGNAIGRMKILRTLGEGGMGVVYAAHDPELDREVAVKLIRGNNSAAARTRLYREAQALAKLSHPNVVAVHDVGTHQGQVWVAMEFVVGRTLGVWIEQERPRWRKVLSVMKQAARGLAAAHAEGLLHRDIKPSNIMVGNDGRVRLMDFGLARAETECTCNDPHHHAARSGALSVDLTTAGTILGTPGYMAPAQFLGQSTNERTDEFSLAVTLWEALYGQRPFIGETIDELRIAVTKGKREPVPATSKVPGWLRKVLERALDASPDKRFESVQAMLEAIEVHEQRERLRSTVAGLSLGLLVMAVLGVVAAAQWRAAETARAALSDEKLVVEEQNAAMRARRAELKDALSVQRGLRARMLIPGNSEGEALKLGVLAVGSYGPEWVRKPPRGAVEGLERVLAEDAVVVRPTLVLKGHEDYLRALAYAPDGSQIATVSADQTARIWDAQSGELLATLKGHRDKIFALAYSPAGPHIATASADETARIWDAQSGELVATLADHDDKVYALRFSPDGSRIATASLDKSARVWDPQSGELLTTLQGHEHTVWDLAYSPDGSRIATASEDQTARVWDAQSGELLATLKGHEDQVYTVSYSPDGSRIATGSLDKTARVWDARTGERLATLEGHESTIWGLSYSPDGARIATASTDQTARLWNAEPKKRIATLKGHNEVVMTVAYSPDGSRIATGSDDKTTRIWDAQSGELLAILHGNRGQIYRVRYSPDGTQIAVGSEGKTAQVWDPQSEELVTLRGHDDKITELVFSPDGTRVATASADDTARIWDAQSGEPLTT
ncbi:MAG: WD40 repeat domain-containing serine/threonine protein kinase, partial [Nannocystaceae bacterium]